MVGTHNVAVIPAQQNLLGTYYSRHVIYTCKKKKNQECLKRFKEHTYDYDFMKDKQSSNIPMGHKHNRSIANACGNKFLQ